VELKDQLAALQNRDLEHLSEAEFRGACTQFLLLVERPFARDAERDAELQRLEDELARLKRQAGSPQFPARRPARTDRTPAASEGDRRAQEPRQPWQEGARQATLRRDRAVVCALDPTQPPADARFKGYLEMLVQDLVTGPDGIPYVHPY